MVAIRIPIFIQMKRFPLVIVFLCTVCSDVQADTLLLAHGYLGSSQQWHRAGIVEELDRAGWRNAGELRLVNEVVKVKKNPPTTTRRMYTLSLQSERSIEHQAGQLNQYVEHVRLHHPDEQIILIGHSAGGVVARLYMVEQSSDDLIALITIASPHLGTDKAQYIEIIPNDILAWLEPIPGISALYRSQGLFFDLIPNRSDNLIGWLNYQEHPPAQYFSIVREPIGDSLMENLSIQDFIVPSWSQDMNEVYALRGRAKTYRLGSIHTLSRKDGEILQKILINLYTI